MPTDHKSKRQDSWLLLVGAVVLTRGHGRLVRLDDQGLEDEVAQRHEFNSTTSRGIEDQFLILRSASNLNGAQVSIVLSRWALPLLQSDIPIVVPVFTPAHRAWLKPYSTPIRFPARIRILEPSSADFAVQCFNLGVRSNGSRRSNRCRIWSGCGQLNIGIGVLAPIPIELSRDGANTRHQDRSGESRQQNKLHLSTSGVNYERISIYP